MPEEGGSVIKTKGVAHFTIPVSDTVRSEAFYTQVLGLAVVQSNHDRGMVFLDSGGDCLILARVEAPVSTARLHDVHHAFVVDHNDYEGALDSLRKDGVEILFTEDRQGGAVNGPRAYFHDPDGNVLEIIDLTSYMGAT